MAEPIATGTLAKTPLPHLLVYLDQKKLSGTLAIWPDDPEATKGQDRILMLKGRPVAGRLLEQAESLREGMLRLFARTSAPYAFYDGNLLGDDRLNGRVDPLGLITEALRSGAREDVVDGVLARFGAQPIRMLPGIDLGRYELLPEERGLIELLQAEPASVEALVKGTTLPHDRGRRLVYLLAITQAVAPLPQAAAHASEAGDGDDDEELDESLLEPEMESPQATPPGGSRAPATPPHAPVATSAPAPPAPPAAATSPADESPAPLPSTPPSELGHDRLDRLAAVPAPPPQLDGELRERWQNVVTKARLIENQNYFEMLGIERNAGAADARTAFFKLAKEWHPDRLPRELAPLKEQVQILFGYFSEAHTTLTNEEERTKYIKNVREGGGTPATERMMQRILESAMSYERVVVMARKREYDQAIELLQEILEVTPDEPDYLAMYVSLLMQKHPGPDAPLRKMLETINRSLELYANSEKANLYKAQILRRMGRGDEALQFFRKVVEINPRNIEAAREVRVANMRKPAKSGKGSKTSEPEGMLGKLFKRK